MANAMTGEVYPLPEGMDVKVGERITREMMPRSPMTDERVQALAAALERQEPIVAVGDETAHKLRLGERELQRRMRRRAKVRRT